jgi:hypothetical protein
MVAEAYNPRNSGDKDQEDCSLRPIQAKKFPRPCIYQWLEVVAYTCHPYTGKQEDRGPGWPRHKSTLPQNLLKQKGVGL